MPAIPTAREAVPINIRIALVTLLKVVPSGVELARGAMVFPADSRGDRVAVARLTANTDGIVPALNT
jgi:hypothetical protein